MRDPRGSGWNRSLLATGSRRSSNLRYGAMRSALLAEAESQDKRTDSICDRRSRAPRSRRQQQQLVPAGSQDRTTIILVDGVPAAQAARRAQSGSSTSPPASLRRGRVCLRRYLELSIDEERCYKAGNGSTPVYQLSRHHPCTIGAFLFISRYKRLAWPSTSLTWSWSRGAQAAPESAGTHHVHMNTRAACKCSCPCAASQSLALVGQIRIYHKAQTLYTH